jgi:hypothetical protein
MVGHFLKKNVREMAPLFFIYSFFIKLFSAKKVKDYVNSEEYKSLPEREKPEARAEFETRGRHRILYARRNESADSKASEIMRSSDKVNSLYSQATILEVSSIRLVFSDHKETQQ